MTPPRRLSKDLVPPTKTADATNGDQGSTFLKSLRDPKLPVTHSTRWCRRSSESKQIHLKKQAPAPRLGDLALRKLYKDDAGPRQE